MIVSKRLRNENDATNSGFVNLIIDGKKADINNSVIKDMIIIEHTKIFVNENLDFRLIFLFLFVSVRVELILKLLSNVY